MAYPLYLTVRPVPSPEDTSALRRLLARAFPAEGNAAYLDALGSSPLPRVTAQRLGALSLLPPLLSEAGIATEDLLLHRDGQGRPYCTATDGTPAGFDFNLSHAEGHVACALLVGDGRVGMDVEEPIPPARALPLIRRYCTEGELAILDSIPPGDELAARYFTSTWVEREALCKQDGGGMPLRFDTANIPEGIMLWTGYLPETKTAIALCAPMKNAPRLPRMHPESLLVVFP